MNEIVIRSYRMLDNIYIHVLKVGDIVYKSCIIYRKSCIFMSPAYVYEKEALSESLNMITNERIHEVN